MNDTIYRVDTHHHILPPFYRQALEGVGQANSGGSPLPPWSAHDALSLMDRQGIEIAITSISAPVFTSAMRRSPRIWPGDVTTILRI